MSAQAHAHHELEALGVFLGAARCGSAGLQHESATKHSPQHTVPAVRPGPAVAGTACSACSVCWQKSAAWG